MQICRAKGNLHLLQRDFQRKSPQMYRQMDSILAKYNRHMRTSRSPSSLDNVSIEFDCVTENSHHSLIHQ